MSAGDGMGSGRRSATAVLSAAMALIGVALVVRSLASGGGAASIGVILGLLFFAAGAGRLYIITRVDEDE